MAQASPQVDPQPIWQIMTAFQHSAAFKAGVETELFTKIGEGNKTASAIGAACGADERGVRILADTLTVLGLLEKSGNEYSLTDVSAAFLDKHSPMYLGSVVEFIMSPQQRRGFDDLTGAVRRGGSAITGDASMDPNSEMWVTFARAMAPMMMPSAQMIAANVGFEPDRELKVLDIAAGHGIFGIMVAKAFPNAQIYALDWENVLAVATENAEKFGVADRHHLIPGSAFDTDLGDGYDVVLVTNFLHHFDAETCTNFMRRVNGSLKPDGKAMTLEFVPNDDRISPPAEALFSLVMLAATPAGDAYTFAELRKMCEAAGFSRNEHIPLVPLPQHLIVSEKLRLLG
jgi:2-polyprenyl-3-methyl-5-hydroxy-6-metoxy-1,4-benzoquinol methylase